MDTSGTAPRPTLRPGLHVVRRDDRHLQVGLDAPHRLVVADDPDVRRVLADLRESRSPAPTTATGHRLLARLRELGLLVDAGLLDAALARAASTGADRTAVLACFARHGDGAAGRLAARAAARVVLGAPAEAAVSLTRLLRAAGVGAVLLLDATGAPPPGASAALLVTTGETPRGLLDPWVRAGLPHLVLTAGARATLGPFVVPGVTACLRCVDAHHGEHDTRRATVLEQCVRAGDDEPVDPAQLATVLGWAVAEIVAHLDGDRPHTWSATATLQGAAPSAPRRWTRHPHCGCAWDALPAAG